MSRRYSCAPRSRPGSSRIAAIAEAELVALRDDPALDGLHLLLEPVDLAELVPVGVAEHLLLELVDAGLEVVDHRVERVGQPSSTR